MNEGEIGAQKEPNQVSDQAQPVEAVVEIGTDGQQTQTTTEGVVKADGDVGTEPERSQEYDAGQEGRTTLAATSENNTSQQQAEGPAAIEHPVDQQEAERLYARLQADIIKSTNENPWLDEVIDTNPESYGDEQQKLLKIISFQRLTDFARTNRAVAEQLKNAHPELIPVLEHLDRQPEQEEQNQAEAVNPDGGTQSDVTPEPTTADVNTNTNPELAADSPLTEKPLAARTPAEVLAYATEWLDSAENSSKPPSMELFVSLVLSVNTLEKQIAETKTALAGMPIEQQEAAVAGFITFQSMLRQAFSKLEQHMVDWQKRELQKDALEANTPETADAVMTQRYGSEKPGEDPKTRWQRMQQDLKGVAGTTLETMWHLNDGASMQTLINFLLTGAEGGYGASGWSKNKGESEDEKEIVPRTVFKDMLLKGSHDLVQTLDKACNEGENNLIAMGLQITEADRKLLEDLARQDNVEERKKHLPRFLEKLNQFFAEDPDRGKRWQAARSVLAESLPDSKGKGKKLPDASGLDLYASVKEEWWKHWK